MKYIYMNEKIRMKKPDGPVIVCQDEILTTEANTFQLCIGDEIIGYVVFDPRGLHACETHDVKAWVEFNDKVEVRPIGKCTVTPHVAKPVAEAKEPNAPVWTKPVPRSIQRRIARYRKK